MGTTVAAMALGAFAMGTGAPGSSAQASISPQERAGTVQIYKIPAGSMGAALNAFAARNYLHLLYDSRVTERLKTPGLVGTYSVQEGLDRLLAGTNLSYRLAENGKAVSIILAQAATGTQSDTSPVALPPVDVTAVQPGQGGTGCGPYGGAPCSGFGGAGLAQDPYNQSYVLPDASTGTKTDTPVMDTPLNVQSVTQQVLQDQQATTIAEALQNVSGAFVQNGIANGNGTRADGLIVRGFQANTYYRDGFRVDSAQLGFDYISSQQLANIASVEVLKGPGAILYGLVDPGGIVNLVTKEPLDTPYFAVQQQIGSLAFYRTTIDATGPVTDDKSVLYRMNMSYENNGAPFASEIDLTHSQNLFLAPVVKWNIDGATWVKLEAQYNEDHGSLYDAFDPLYNGAFVNIPRSTNYGASAPDEQTTIFTALTWSHQFDKDWSIKQQIAYERVNENYVFPSVPFFIETTAASLAVGGLNAQIQGAQTTWSTNVDITGHIDTFGALHTLLLGGDVYRLVGSEADAYAEQYTQIGLFNPTHPGTLVPLCPCSTFGNNFTQDTAGLYLQDQIKLPYNIFLLAGARYQYIRQTNGGGETLSTLMPQGNPLVGQALTPRFGLLWRPQDWVSLYGNYVEGFGPNSGLIYPGTLAPPSNASSWEAGVKFEFFNGKLRATADYFDLVKTNIPTTDPNPTHICAGGPCSILVGEAASKGVELDIQGEFLPGWSVIANYTNDDVRVTEGTGISDLQVYGLAPGDRFPGVPRDQANFWTTYEFRDETLKGLKIGAGYHYSGAQLIFDAPAGYPLLPSYGTINLMAAYSFQLAGAKVTAQLNITNLFDKTYYTAASISPPLSPGFQGGAYRTYGAPFAAVGSLRAEWPGNPSSPLSVAPPPLASAFTWTGPTLGGQIGYAWGINTGNVSYATPGGLFGANDLGGDAQGAIGGAHVGYNYQIDQWVIGVEGAVDGSTLNRTSTIGYVDPTGATDANGYPLGGTEIVTVRSGIQGSIRGRAGVALDRLLIYGTGGVAFAKITTDFYLGGEDTSGAFSTSDGRSTTRTGWTAGGGIEYAINNNWSVRSEYRYSDFGHITDVPAAPVAGLAYVADRHLAQNQVQVGFSYKFDSSPASVVAKY